MQPIDIAHFNALRWITLAQAADRVLEFRIQGASKELRKLMNRIYKIFVAAIFTVLCGAPLIAAADQAASCQQLEVRAQCDLKVLKKRNKTARVAQCRARKRTFKVRCLQNEICGQPKFFCPPDRLCAEVMPQPRTYENAQALKKDGATLLYYGACHPSGEVHAF